MPDGAGAASFAQGTQQHRQERSCFSPDGQHAWASAYYDQTIRVWEAPGTKSPSRLARSV